VLGTQETSCIIIAGLLERDSFDLLLSEFDKPWVIHLRETCCCSTNLCTWRPNTVYKDRSVRRHQVSQWDPVEEKFRKKIARWKGNMLSIGDRVTLVNACLSSIALYMLSFLEAPKGFINKADMHRKRMVWQEIDGRKRYHLVNWHTVCLPKDCGGLGVLDLTIMNKSLLCKWLWKFENTEGTWQ
jgi:hypothetical protein